MCKRLLDCTLDICWKARPRPAPVHPVVGSLLLVGDEQLRMVDQVLPEHVHFSINSIAGI